VKLKDLITDPRDGSLSHTKIGSCIGLAAITAAFIKSAWAGTMTPELMLVYGGLTSASHFANNWLAQRLAKATPQP